MVIALELAFEWRQLRDLCTKSALAERKLGKRIAEKLHARLADMRSATTATELLVGGPKEIEADQMAIELGDGARIVFCANHQDVPRYKKGNVNWSKVTRIKIARIEAADDNL
jgi:hypothetical protein